MSNIFRSAEAMAQGSALNEYANSLREIGEEREKESEQVKSYNERLRGITDPIGGVLVAKPAESAIRAGVQKALGRGAKAVEKKLSEKLSSFVNGESNLVDNLPSNVGRSLKAVLQDNPGNEVQNAFRNLSDKARQTINKARVASGKRPISEEPQAPEPVSAETSTSAVTDTPTAETQADLNDAGNETLESVRSDANSALARFNRLPPESQADLASQYRNNPLRINNPQTPEDFRTNLNLRNQAVDQEEARLGQGTSQGGQAESGGGGGGDAPAVGQAQAEQEGDAIFGRRATPLQATPDNPGGANQENQAGDPVDSGDPSNASGANTDATDAMTGADTTEDVTSGLADVADTLDAVAGATSEIPIVGEILAGIAGLATILGGSLGAKPPPTIKAQPITSAIQYGV